MSYVLGGCNVHCSCYTEHCRYGLSCLYAETVECMSNDGSVWYVGLSYIVKFILMDMADMDRWKTVESFVVCIVGKMAQDGLKVLWCDSHLVWLDFEGSIPTCARFHSENIFDLLTLAAHAQRGLQYLVCVSVCLLLNISLFT